MFRASHTAMDGRALFFWVAEVFRALRGEPLLGSPSTYTDEDIRGKFQDKIDRNAVVTPAKCIPVLPCSTPPKSDLRYVWRAVVFPAVLQDNLARFAIFLAEYARRSATGPVAFVVPVDLRTQREEVRSLANLTGYPVMPIEPGDTP